MAPSLHSGRLKLTTLSNLTLFTLLFLGIYFVLEHLIRLRHELSVFLAFLVLPLLYLLYRKRGYGEALNLGAPDTGFLEGVGIYLIFTGYVLIYFHHNPDFFDQYRWHGLEASVSLLLTALNVASVDFFTKRVIQLPIKKEYGSKIAIGLQTAVWLAAHYPESLWLGRLMGDAGVWIFLVFTGLVTGISYNRTENVNGQMTGHVLLNLIIVGLVTFR